ncbi:MAG: galactose-1-phosphate uridylyltransferase [Candidatus Rokubacteria bacterium]|nr:galactose-1-phosphate uridylyltransferase [Candidatus Rokubacteria bacterium]
MSDLRKDPTRSQWVLVRPRGAVGPEGAECPFCPGNESATPPEIAAYRKEGSAPNSPGWQVRVIPEADPYFRVEWDLVREGVGMYDKITPRGASELIIESPSHEDTLATMGPDQLERVLWMYRDRLVDLKRDTKIRDILITRRHRKPGSRLTHPYSRVTAIPVIFDDLRRELWESQDYYQYKHRCLFCDILRQELSDDERVVRLTPFFLLVIPYAARSPFETWVLPRQHACAYETLSPEIAADLARLLTGYFGALVTGLGNPSFELSLHTAPNLHSKILQGEWATISDDYHWHFEIVIQPERANRLGGIFINEVPPDEAARRLREAWQ